MTDAIAPFLKNTMPTTQIEMTLSGRNLKNTDILSKSDPYCLISMKESWQDNFHQIAKTETIQDTLNPEWVKKVILNYNFESIQKIRFEIRDEDYNGSDFLGFYETTVSDLVSFSGRQFVGKLKGRTGENFGEIIVVTEEVISCKQIAEIQFAAQNLPSSMWSCLGHTRSPFLIISRANEDGKFSVVTKTEVLTNTQDPIWKAFTIRVTTLCNGDFDRTLKIDCFDYNNSGDHKLIGTCYSSLRRLISPNEPRMVLDNERKRKQDPSYSGGFLRVNNSRIMEELSFLDFIRGGTQMHFAVAIDFTASNGPHTDPNSLHYISHNRLNFYEIALHGVGDIIQYYSSSKQFPAFGFGARIPPNGQVSHQFPLNGNPTHPFCSGIDEILIQYRNQLNSGIQFYGPTNFAPVINNTISIASEFQDGRNYFVLLIITDGQISDMHETKRAIINASLLPISIIIVGVGNADFDNMDELDSDDRLLRIDGLCAKRDIVQFVPLNKYLMNNGLNQYIKSQADLAKEVLAEIPGQLTAFMRSKGYKPQNTTEYVPPSSSTIVPTAPMS
ncbi:copine-8-like [Contarinia nasturtii]|uniref:copine-8-like n=1 Tax=Contarinia nasturtii TaxID=265458 RepID=UPI0012D4837B|nr:copine-8-like [Contarinia nasturtii]XP_031628976.1 copine-8-like [Contarinia nasturtii]